MNLTLQATYRMRSFLGSYDTPETHDVTEILDGATLVTSSDVIEAIEQFRGIARAALKGLPRAARLIRKSLGERATKSQAEFDRYIGMREAEFGVPKNTLLIRGAMSDARDRYARNPRLLIVRLELLVPIGRMPGERATPVVIYEREPRAKIRAKRRHEALFVRAPAMEAVPSFTEGRAQGESLLALAKTLPT